MEDNLKFIRKIFGEVNINKVSVRCPDKILGYYVDSRTIKYSPYKSITRRNFRFSKYEDPLTEAIKFRDTDPYVSSLVNFKNALAKTKKLNAMKRVQIRKEKAHPKDLKTKFDRVLKKYNIINFPHYNKNNTKFISIDVVGPTTQVVFIKECKLCHKHNDIRLQDFEKVTPYCINCSTSVNNGFFRLSKVKIGHDLVSEIRISIGNKPKTIIRIYKYLKSHTASILKEYEIYFKFTIDKFIREHNLKFENIYTDEEFFKIQNYLDSGAFKLELPTITTNEKLVKDYSIKLQKQSHIFKATLDRVGFNKYTNTKTLLLKNVEYIGIDNFRDHFWAVFDERFINLKRGDEINFIGEIYDYEKKYIGQKKVGQAIKIIKIIE